MSADRNKKILAGILLATVLISVAMLLTKRAKDDDVPRTSGSQIEEVARPDIAEGHPSRSNVVKPSTPIVEDDKEVILFGLRKPKKQTLLDRVMLPDDALINVIDSLASKADSGDGESALQLGRSLAFCSGAPRTLDELSARVNQAETLGIEHVFGARITDVGQYAAEQERNFKFCDGITDDQIVHFAKRLDQAAEFGQLEAQYEFQNESVPMVLRRKANALIWESEEEFLTYKVQYLQVAADAGSSQSMVTLGQLALKGLVPNMSKNEASAYFIAGVAANEAAGLPVGLFVQRAERLLNEGSPADTKEILALGQQLLDSNNCCSYFKPMSDGDVK